jgi:hypothetical protein
MTEEICMDVHPLNLPVNSPSRMLELIIDNSPGMTAAVNSYNDRLAAVYRELLMAMEHPAVRLIAGQTLNDFNDVLFDVMAGRGSSALRGTRTLIEDVLSFHAVSTDEELAGRYIDHWPIGVRHAMDWDPLSRYLTGKAAKAAAHHRRKLIRETEREVEELVNRYGQAFLRSWHASSVANRAEQAGLAEMYPFYRYLSASIHGAAISGAGTFWAYEGELVSRLGPALQTCPPALATSLILMRKFLDLAAAYEPRACGALSAAVSGIDTQMADYLKTIGGLERMFFNEEDPRIAATAKRSMGWRTTT